MDLPETDCHELTERSAAAIDDPSLNRLFVSTQMNNLDLCVKSTLQYASCIMISSKLDAPRFVLMEDKIGMHDAILCATCNFPHYWVSL